MLPKKRKVNKAILKGILKQSKIMHSSYFSLRYIKNNLTKESKFSFVVSKKVANKAPKRNLLKRRGYFVIKEVYKSIETGFICVFFLKKEASLLKFSDFRLEIINLLKKVHIIR